MPAKKLPSKTTEWESQSNSINTLHPDMMNRLMHNLPGMAYRCNNDAEWTMLFVSEGCEGLTGYHPLELLHNGSRSYEELIHPDDRDLVRQAVEDGVQGHKPFKVQYRIIHKSGSTVHVWEQGSAVYSHEGSVLFLDGFITDITYRVKVERTLMEETARMGERDKLKDAIFSIVAHDLQNPVYAIISNGEFLIHNHGQIKEAEWVEFIRQITSTARDMQHLLDNLVEWTRLKSDMLIVQSERFVLESLVQDCLQALKAHLDSKKVEVKLNITPDIILNSDKKLFTTIASNILSNAVKYSRRGGVIEVSAFQGEGSVELRITDHGVGMSRGDLRNVFDILKRVKRLGTAKETGSGLGLMLTSELAHQLGIAIDLQSKLNSGTIVTLQIPGK